MTTEQISNTEHLQLENGFLRQEVQRLKEQIEWFKRQFFGKKSEKEVWPKDQLSLFDLIGHKLPEEQPAPQQMPVQAHSRVKPNRNGQDSLSFPEDLPRETTVIDLPEEKKVCPESKVALVKIGEEEGVLGGQERHMIQKLLDLGERPVKDIMTPRTDLIGLDIEEPSKKHEELIRKFHFTRLPVFQGSMDHILGVVESQSHLLQEPLPDVKQVMLEPLFVPESKRIDDLLGIEIKIRNSG